MVMKVYIKKALNVFFWIMDKADKKHYKKLYPKYLHWLGIDIDTKNTEGTWISPTTFWDSSKYEYIKIGTYVTISFDVAVLVHDLSIIHAAKYVGKNTRPIICKKVEIGNNVFIGARTTILPGSVIGDNCIVGSGSVVRGCLEKNSIYAGNPCKKIGTIEDYIEKHRELIYE